MTKIHLMVLDRVLAGFKPGTAILLTPNQEQTDCFVKHGHAITVLFRNDWDITQESELRADMIYLSNVMMYISDPRPVIKNLTKSGKIVLIQDVIYRDRSGNGSEFGSDGDCMRYSFGSDRTKAPNSFDLSYLQPAYYESYMDEAPYAKHFIMALGVRPDNPVAQNLDNARDIAPV